MTKLMGCLKSHLIIRTLLTGPLEKEMNGQSPVMEAESRISEHLAVINGKVKKSILRKSIRSFLTK